MTDYTATREQERRANRALYAQAFPAYLRSVHGLTDAQINGKANFRCLNPQHNDSTPSMKFYGDHVFCFGCSARYDLPELIAADNGLTTADRELWAIVQKWTGSDSLFQSGQSRGAAQTTTEKEDAAPQQPQDFAKYYEECYNRRSDPHFIEYMKSRGFLQSSQELDILSVYKVGFDPLWIYPGTKNRPQPFVIIPTGRGNYTARRAAQHIPKNAAKVLKIPKGGSNPLYNLPAFMRNTALFITEGELDALAIEQCGGTAAALGSTSNARELLQLIPALCQDRTAPIIIMTDADTAGRDAAAELARGFTEMRQAGQIPAIRVLNFTAYPDGTNDPNDLLKQAPDLLKAIVRKVGYIENIIDRLARIAGLQIITISESEGILI